MNCCIMDVGSNIICSLEIDGIELAVDLLDSLDTLGLIVADEIAGTKCNGTGSNSVTIEKPYHQVSRDILEEASVRKQGGYADWKT
jgi:hypothetical protein